MHACRNMHIILSCKDALARFVQQHKDDSGQPFVSDDEFEELMFEYDKCVSAATFPRSFSLSAVLVASSDSA